MAQFEARLGCNGWGHGWEGRLCVGRFGFFDVVEAEQPKMADEAV